MKDKILRNALLGPTVINPKYGDPEVNREHMKNNLGINELYKLIQELAGKVGCRLKWVDGRGDHYKLVPKEDPK